MEDYIDSFGIRKYRQVRIFDYKDCTVKLWNMPESIYKEIRWHVDNAWWLELDLTS